MSATARAGVISGVPISSVSGGPATSSITMYGRWSWVPTSRTDTQLMCCKRLSARASRAKRRTYSLFDRYSACKSLSATWRPSLARSAR